MFDRGQCAAGLFLAVAVLSASGRGAVADPPSFAGTVSTDFRASLGAPVWDGWPSEVGGDERGDLIWNLNQIEFRLKQRLNPHVRYEAHLRLDFDGLSLASADGMPSLDDLTNSAAIDPFWLESDAAYVEMKNLFDGFDLVFGRQIVTWGASDRFRPTNNISPDDVWDPLRFGIVQANEMIRMLYNPVGDLIFEAVVVPSFRPARLPASATAALIDPNATLPVLETDVVRDVLGLRETMGILGLAFRETSAVVAPPDTSLENVQVGARVSWRAGENDMSLSYYRGFDDFPHPVRSVATIDSGMVDTVATLAYPRIQVVGFDIAGSIGFLDEAGFRLEGAVVFPEAMTMTIDMPAGFDDIVGHVVDGRPFLKATLGIDYTFTRDIFVIGMLVHGLFDEFGPQLASDFADSVDVEVTASEHKTVTLGPQGLGDYVVAGADFKFLNSKLLLRLFGIVSLDTDHFSAVAYPLLQWNPWGSWELEAGGYVLFGDRYSKFGQPAAGGSLAFLRSRVRF